MASHWHHIRSELNPADAVFRGASIEELKKKCNWLQGPEFLQKYDPSWSENNISHDLLNVAYEEIEGKRKVYMKTIKVEDELSSIYKLFLKFLSWFKLKKIAAWVMRVRRMLLYRSKKRNYCAVDMPV